MMGEAFETFVQSSKVSFVLKKNYLKKRMKKYD